MNYLMLNKDDITEVCGVISKAEVKKELVLTEHQFWSFVYLGKIFREKYILVEEEFKKERQEIVIKEVKGDRARTYSVDTFGRFYIKWKKSGKKREIFPYIKKKTNTDKKYLALKIDGKEYVAKNLIAAVFIRSYKKNDIVICNDGDFRNIRLDNLNIVQKKEYYKGRTTSKNAKVGLFENNELVQSYPSTRKAGSALFLSRQTICDYCNNKVKKPIYDLRWIC